MKRSELQTKAENEIMRDHQKMCSRGEHRAKPWTCQEVNGQCWAQCKFCNSPFVV